MMEGTSLYNKVIRFISIRPRSEKEISSYIKEKLYKRVKDYSEIEEIISKILKSLKEINLVDDESFAKSFIEWRLTSANPKGFRIIRSELAVKGVERDLVDNLLSDEKYKTMEVEAAKKVVSKKLKFYKEPFALKKYLFTRGFTQSSIESAFEDSM